MRLRPAGASVSMPSIVSFGMVMLFLSGGRRLRDAVSSAILEWAAPQAHVIFELAAVLRHEAFDRHRKAVCKHTDRVAFHIDGGVDENLQVLHFAAARFKL